VLYARLLWTMQRIVRRGQAGRFRTLRADL
jgi:hypothetical protein